MPGVLGTRKVEKKNRNPIAIIDIGSNSVRLVIYDGAKRAPFPVFNEKLICGLGRDLDKRNAMSDVSMELAIGCLRRFVSLVDSMGISNVRAVATAAVREAVNGVEFIERVNHECGLGVDVLSGEQEAELSGKGVVSGIPNATGITGDLGGGSVELIKLHKGQLQQSATLPLGALRACHKRDLNSESFPKFFEKHLSGLDWLPSVKGQNFYAVGGAWRSLARIHMEQMKYPLHVIHQYTIEAKEALSFTGIVGNLGRSTLEGVHGLNKERIDSIPYAARLMEKLLQVTNVSKVVFCAYGLREGCIFDSLSYKYKQQDALIEMTKEIGGCLGRNMSNGDILADWISPVFNKEKLISDRIRNCAANLADIGWLEHPDYRTEQVFLRILRMPLVSISHQERVMLAISVASRHSGVKDIIRRWKVDNLLIAPEIAEARAVGVAMRLAYTLTGGSVGLLNRIGLERKGDSLKLIIPSRENILVGEIVEHRVRALAISLECDYEILLIR